MPNKSLKQTAKGAVKLTLIVCILCAIVCVCLFSATTYAWFSDSVTATGSNIVSADYSIISTLYKDETTVAPTTSTALGVKEYDLTAGEYKITFTAQGSASTGFAFIKVKTASGTSTYYTQQITPNAECTITLSLAVDAIVTLDYQWGNHGRTENVITNSLIIN